MRFFHDSKNRRWCVSVNVAQDRRVREKCDFHLKAIFDAGLEKLIELAEDGCKLCDVLKVLMERQLQEAGVAAEDFEEAMGGREREEALDALAAEVVDFFPNRKQQEALHLGLQRMREATARAGEEAVRKLLEGPEGEGPSPPASRLNGSSGSAPESSVLTRPLTPSASST